MSTIESKIKDYNKLKNELINAMADCKEIYIGLGKIEMAKATEESINKTKRESFKVMIMGQFNAGKSTTINAMLGEKILPTAIVETTAIINEIKYAPTEKAIVYFKNPPPKIITKYIPERIKQHIKKYSGTEITPIEISIDEIDSVAKLPKVTELKKGLSQNEKALDNRVLVEREITTTPFEKLEIFWPLKLCKDGVEIVDTPGLNASTETEEITLDFVQKADTVIFILSAIQACSKQEMDAIQRICSFHTNTFFIINRINQVSGNTPEEREEQCELLMESSREKLSDYTKLGEDGIIAINAFGAITGRAEGNDQMVKESKIIDFEEALAKFLTEDKGKVKLEQNVKEVKNNIQQIINDVIPNKIKSLEMDLSVLEKKYKDIQPKLEDARKKKNQIIKKIDIKTAALKNEARTKIKKQMEYIRDNIGDWIKNINLENKVKIFEVKNSSSLVIQEIGERLQVIIEKEQKEWSEKELTPLLTQKITEISEDINYSINDFCADIDKIKFDLFSMNSSNYSGPSTAERVTCALAGLFLMDFGTAVVGGAMGFGAMMKNMAIQLSAIITLMIVGLFNPVTFLAVILGSVVWNILGGGLTKKIQKKAAEEARKEMEKQVEDYTDKFVEKITENTEQMFKPIASVLDGEINSIEEEINSILSTKKEGENEIKKKKQLFKEYKDKLDKIYTDVDKISMKLNA